MASFACVHVPNFILQAAIRADSALAAGAGDRAIAIIERAPPLERVVAANRAATALGIRPGATRAQTEEFEALLLLRRSAALEQAAHAALLDLGWSISPRVEDTAADTIALDLEGLLGLFGSEKNIARRLVQGAGAMNFAVHVAVAGNLDAAYHAARGFSGITLIPRGEEARCLGGLPLAVLGLAPEMLETLDAWGIRSCAALAALPILELSERLGQQGVRLHALARGLTQRAMIVAEPEASFEEAMELDTAVADLEPLTFILARLLDQLCVRLAARALAAAAIRLRFDLEPGCRPRQLREPQDGPRRPAAQDAAAAAAASDSSGAYEKTLTLPVPMRDSQLLLSLLRLLLQSQPPSRAIRKVALTAVAAPRRGAQGGLFVPARPQPEKLELTIARLVHLVGEAHVGAPELVDSHRPGKFRMARFSVAPEKNGKAARPKVRQHEAREEEDREEKVRQQEGREEAQEETDARDAVPRTAFRCFRPPLPARVELSGGRPNRLFFQGHAAAVAAASGPWRSSGEWWDVAAWNCDEWDVEVRFPSAPVTNAMPGSSAAVSGGVYRIFFDGIRREWFVCGAYD